MDAKINGVGGPKYEVDYRLNILIESMNNNIEYFTNQQFDADPIPEVNQYLKLKSLEVAENLRNEVIFLENLKEKVSEMPLVVFIFTSTVDFLETLEIKLESISTINVQHQANVELKRFLQEENFLDF